MAELHETPLSQFRIETIVPIHVGGIDVSFTNSAAMMVLAVLACTALLVLAGRPASMIPGRLQSIGELAYEFIAGMVRENCGTEGMTYFPWVFSIFMFVLFGNFLGMIPYTFTFTSHIIVTFALAAMVFLTVTAIAFARHGLHFFSFFLPEGTPWWLTPLVVPLEILSYFIRPVSLSIRLFANMMAGHTMLKVFGGFVILLGVFGVLPFVVNVALTLFEFLVAALQAYVFTILTCLYLKDAIELH
ncbi:MAG: F0F1 ATP synthase subunit A [Aliidongia sp.]